ncbi:MAG: LITAF-like zinc ribbon domain-containing protein [Pyrinomonadaceae bacterium]|nr:LITAF-like zinc ribbon domain-containing protein [Pyrinomonadaceae bacterium]
MIACSNCGQQNTDESQFCRFCGHRMAGRQAESYDFQPPRPYSWKTDEYQTQTDARARVNIPAPQQVQQPAFQGHVQHAGPLAYAGPKDLSGNYRCPFCGTNFLPVMERRVSTGGWITFGILLALTVVFFWIGLLMKENVPVCPICKRQVS